MHRDSSPPSIPDPDDDAWTSRLQWKRIKTELPNGDKVYVEVLDANLRNLVILLRCLPEWRGVLALDEFSLSIVTLREPPWHADDRPPVPWRRGAKWNDEDFTRARVWFEGGFYLSGRIHEMKPTKANIEDAIPLVAQCNGFHPLREHLDALQWDRIDRIGGSEESDVPGWLHTYLGARDDEYTRAVGRWWLIALVARAYRPGCQSDHMLVLEGRQGRGKSSALRIIGGPFFTDQIQIDAIATKDGKQLLHSGKWLIEFAELDGLTRAESSRVKAGVTATHDMFRAPYAKTPKEHPRQCAFAGSVNDRTWLKDETGNRRFWPIEVEEDGPIDLAALARDRNALLAQAIILLHSGAQWWPPASETDLAGKIEDQQAQRLMTDDWTDRISAWLDEERTQYAIAARKPFPFVTTTEIAAVLGIEIGRWQRSEQMRAGGCLVRLGFERVQIRHQDGSGRRAWVYRPPDPSRPATPPQKASNGSSEKTGLSLVTTHV